MISVNIVDAVYLMDTLDITVSKIHSLDIAMSDTLTTFISVYNPPGKNNNTNIVPYTLAGSTGHGLHYCSILWTYSAVARALCLNK